MLTIKRASMWIIAAALGVAAVAQAGPFGAAQTGGERSGRC